MTQPCQWNSQYDGLYSTGEIYHITTTHNVDSSTGALLKSVKLPSKHLMVPFHWL